MKVSISLPEKDIDFIDRYITEHGELSRSAVVRKALDRLQAESLEAAYYQRWMEWSEEDELWDSLAGDGLEDEPDGAW